VWQFVVAIEAAPTLPGRLGEHDDLGGHRFLSQQPFDRTFRWRTMANVLSLRLVVRGCFQCSALTSENADGISLGRSEDVPGRKRLKTFVSVTAYHPFT